MKTKNVLTASFFCLFLVLTSCIYSVHPLYSEDTVSGDLDLLGKWSESDEENTWWHFFPGEKDKDDDIPDGMEKGVYGLTYSQAGKSFSFLAVVVKLGQYYYLDMYPIEDIKLGNDLLERTLFPTHHFARISLVEGEIRFDFFKYDWLSNLFEESRIRLDHEKSEAGILLTATTEELQKFIIKYGHLPEAYDKSMTLLKRE